MLGLFDKKPQAQSHSHEAEFRAGFRESLPEGIALDYVMDLWAEYPFSFKVAGSRKTCLGNYIYKNRHHYISVNGDSNPYSFLITLIHEIAHQRVKINELKNLNPLFKRRKKILPHGDEWKFQFKTLMAPLLKAEVFPEDILSVLRNHMINPPASSTKDHDLVRVLAKYSPTQENYQIYLSDLPDGKNFVFKGRSFKRIKTRRTRILVECTSTQKQYTIPAIAQVKPLE